jgi:hypothetical protein
MATQSEPQARASRLLSAPIILEIAVGEMSKSEAAIIIDVSVGRRHLQHREITVFYDAFDEIPVYAINALCSWILALARVEAGRRLAIQGKPIGPLARFPDWPPT